ncbi:MAG TPA: oligosaccharide flippase family protein [Armatimonadota bacterium]|jgi:O-antigen/teichoic acid export membrane protein
MTSETTEQGSKPAPPSLLRQISHYLGGQVAVMAAGLISMPVLARALGKERWGTASLVISMMVLLSAVSKGGLSQSAIRFAGRTEEGKEHEERALQSSLILTSLVSSLTLALLLVAGWYWWNHGGGGAGLAGRALTLILGGKEAAPYMALAGVLLVVRTVTAILWALQRAERRSGAFTVYNILLRYGGLVCSIGAWYLFHTLTAYFTGILLAEGLVTVYYLVDWWRGHRLSMALFSPAMAWMALAYGLPMIGSEVSSVLVAYVDKFIIQSYRGVGAVGIYAAGYGIAEVLLIVLAFPIELAVTPHCFRLWEAEGEQRTAEFVSSATARYAITIFPILALFASSAHAVVRIMAGSQYTGAVTVLPWALAGIGLWCGFYPLVGMGYFIRKQTAAFTSILGLSVLFNVGLNWVLVPRYGYMGAAYATFLTYLAVLFMVGAGSAKRLRVHWQWTSMLRGLALSVGIAWGLYLVPIGQGIPATLLRVTVGAFLYTRVMAVADANARWMLSTGARWLQERGIGTKWYHAVTGLG